MVGCVDTLADANKSVEEATKAENSNTEDTATKNNTDKSEKTQESAGAAAEETDSESLEHGHASCEVELQYKSDAYAEYGRDEERNI